MGMRECFVGSSQGYPERHVPIVEQCNRSAEGIRRGVFLSAAEEMVVVVVVVVVETTKL
jgi:hypothetical protein